MKHLKYMKLRNAVRWWDSWLQGATAISRVNSVQTSDSDSDGDSDSGEANSGHFMYKAYCRKSLQILQKGSNNPKS